MTFEEFNKKGKIRYIAKKTGVAVLALGVISCGSIAINGTNAFATTLNGKQNTTVKEARIDNYVKQQVSELFTNPEANSTYNNVNYNYTLPAYVGAEVKEYQACTGTSLSKGELNNMLSNVINPNNASTAFEFLRIDRFRPVNESLFAQAIAGKGSFNGQAEAFIGAAKKYNIDPVYLLAQAGLESAWGSSNFAKGTVITRIQTGNIGANPTYKELAKPVTVYNFYGAGAYNNDPTYALTYAYNHGWTSPSAAIYGAAKFLANDYIYGGYKQNTPYEIRFVDSNATPLWHQYASDSKYAAILGDIINEHKDLYLNGDTFEFSVPKFKGMNEVRPTGGVPIKPSVPAPVVKPSTPAPVVKPSVPAPVVKPSTPAPVVKPSVPAPVVKPSTPAPVVKPSTPAPVVKPSTPAPVVKPSTPAPVVKPSTPAPVVKPSTPAPVVKPSTPAPVVKPSTPAPVVKPSTPAPVVKPSTPAPVVKPSTPAPVVKPSTPAPVVKPSTPAPVVKPSTPAPVVKPSTPAPVVKPSTPAPVVKPNIPAPVVKPSTPAPVVKPSTPAPVVKPSTSVPAKSTTSIGNKDIQSVGNVIIENNLGTPLTNTKVEYIIQNTKLSEGAFATMPLKEGVTNKDGVLNLKTNLKDGNIELIVNVNGYKQGMEKGTIKDGKIILSSNIIKLQKINVNTIASNASNKINKINKEAKNLLKNGSEVINTPIQKTPTIVQPISKQAQVSTVPLENANNNGITPIKNENIQSQNPKTGDASEMPFVVGLLGAAAGIILTSKRKIKAKFTK